MKHIPLMVPFIPESVVTAVTETLKTRWIGQGPKVEEFEKLFSERIGLPAVAVGSCTDALHLAYILAGIGPGDEVIAPLFTCTATNIPLLYLGAKIKFADVRKGSLNMDPMVEELVSTKTKAVVVVHYGGMPVQGMSYLQEFCLKRKIVLIEDCAQALGGTYDNKPLGSFGDFSCFSFQAVKHVCTGDGGMLTIRNPELMEKAKRMRWFGIDRKAKLEGVWANDITEIGYKYQMTDIAASMGIAGLERLEYQMHTRRKLRQMYIHGLSGVPVDVLDTDMESACWLLTVSVENRDGLRRKLAENGIESDQVHYRNDRYSIFSEFRGDFPNMDAIDPKYLVIPMHMGMTMEDVRYVCKVIQSGW
jgi:perosamine synthetase